MSLSLLVAPALLAGFLLPPADRLGAVASRAVMAMFALAALAVGAGSLEPTGVADYGGGGAGQALFVSVTLGILLGGLAPWPPTGWRRWVGGLPLVAVLLTPSLGVLRVFPFLLGVVLGAMPLLVGGVVPRVARAVARAGDDGVWWTLVLTTALAALAPVLLLALLAPSVALGLTILGIRRGRWPRRVVVLPALAALAGLAVAAVAIDSSGDPLLRPDVVRQSMDLLSGSAPLVGGLAMIMLIALVAPWPFARFGPGPALLPTAAILGHRMAWTLVPVGMAGWAPAAALILVPSAVVAAWRGRWPVALGALALVPVASAEPLAPVAIALSVVAAVSIAWRQSRDRGDPAHGVTFPRERWIAGCTALAVAGVTAVLLGDEVVMASVLATGIASAAARPLFPRSHQTPEMTPPSSTDDD